MKNKFSVTKSSGLTEPFSIKKLRSSLAHAKASPGEIDAIVKTLLPKLYQGISWFIWIVLRMKRAIKFPQAPMA